MNRILDTLTCRRLRLLLLLLLLWPLLLSAQPEGQSNLYRSRVISDVPGFPNVQVQDVLLDDQRVLWLRTLTGLVEYNGYAFRTWGGRMAFHLNITMTFLPDRTGSG